MCAELYNSGGKPSGAVQNVRTECAGKHDAVGNPRAVSNRSTLIRFTIVREVRATFSLTSRATNWEEEAYRYRSSSSSPPPPRRHNGIIRRASNSAGADVARTCFRSQLSLGALRVDRRGYNRRCTWYEFPRAH